MTDRMMDGPTRKGIEEAIRFLSPGQCYDCMVDDHDVTIVRLAKGFALPFFVACRTCARFCGNHDARRVYPAIYKHTEAPIDAG